MMTMSLIPMVFGWRSTVVLSGSMTPRIIPGDVVASAPLRGRPLQKGQVILVNDPTTPGHLLMHRFLGVDGQGRLITRGDANRDNDSLQITMSDVVGLPRIRVPWIGLPSLWVQQHRLIPLLLILAMGTTVCVIAFGRRMPPLPLA